MDEEDGRSGARAVQTGRLDGHQDVRTLSLYTDNVVILGKLIEQRTIIAAKICGCPSLPSRAPFLRFPFVARVGNRQTTSNPSGARVQIPGPGLRTRTPLIQSEEKNENVPGK